ncbi:unnamed protein product [Didymodactylos carnosus]|uniref:CMP/dCMP-type deaminase domain-containing protein n=1 Tax=Didymodactylos carnosus TaxID=1234261 RepID=A0A816ETW8_9BILA|nr:unnamed protein product [Didymodactylos carnosus]CAF1650330.1 unnamed protein product [Didymodactylos carnosus]CAF3847414.1 unnamed protein product [Didymodactylos carnosus]CAF4577369.1 unnamed protein product [Didymodactylos carnosus]
MSDSKVTNELKNIIPDTKYYLTNDEVNTLTTKYGISTEQLIIELIDVVKVRAKCVTSKCYVGAIGVGRQTKNFYFGVNLEFSGQTLAQSVHAEQFLIALAHCKGEEGIELISVSHFPCGHCRQFLNELYQSDKIKILLPNEQLQYSLSDLLPYAFNLGTGYLLSFSSVNKLKLKIESTEDPLVHCAFKFALNSYAPYSNSPSSVGIQLDTGEMFAGAYLESVAYNPSLPPLQVALVHLIANGKEYEQIKRVILLELESSYGCPSQFYSTFALLRSIAPNVTLETYELSVLNN